jgi:hypothetical protein
MNDNVIILGAGFSFDAGIPLLGGFIERMWEYSTRGKAGDAALSEKEKTALLEALEIRRDLDGCHGRVTFDDRNIEDILSMLAFNVLGGGRSESNKLAAFTNAISTTIELACNVKHPGYPQNQRFTAVEEGSELYRRFWKCMFNWYGSGKEIPTIITFNYDLVLERSLMQVLINTYYGGYDNRLPFSALTLDYKYRYFSPEHYRVKYTSYGSRERKEGSIIERMESQEENRFANIDLLKLHGSLNYPKSKSHLEKDPPSLTSITSDPYILPPVSNKRSNGAGDESWRVALNKLREAKNVVFVGYSLPKTDMYMQFFLKAALGPNQELNRLYVFDPVLWSDNSSSAEMRARFEQCFAEQLRPRIDFNPSIPNRSVKELGGTTAHFIDVLEDDPSSIFF